MYYFDDDIVSWTGNHTYPQDLDFIYEIEQEQPTHQIFNLLDGEII
jgi:hypothetical protein